MKNQEFKQMVTNAIDALEQQGKECLNYDGQCKYLNENGMCCIVGHMMPDNKTREDADLESELGRDSCIIALSNIAFSWCMQFTDDQILLLSKLQYIHDTPPDEYFTFENRITHMRNLAEKLSTENNV